MYNLNYLINLIKYIKYSIFFSLYFQVPWNIGWYSVNFNICQKYLKYGYFDLETVKLCKGADGIITKHKNCANAPALESTSNISVMQY